MNHIDPMPTDADGQWLFMGEIQGTTLDRCGSRSGGEDWWRATDAHGNVDYTQQIPDRLGGDEGV